MNLKITGKTQESTSNHNFFHLVDNPKRSFSGIFDLFWLDLGPQFSFFVISGQIFIILSTKCIFFALQISQKQQSWKIFEKKRIKNSNQSKKVKLKKTATVIKGKISTLIRFRLQYIYHAMMVLIVILWSVMDDHDRDIDRPAFSPSDHDNLKLL